MKFIVFLLEIAIIAVAAVWLINHPGDVVITWQEYQMQTSLAVFAGLALVAFIVFHLAVNFWRFIVMLPARMHQRSKALRTKKGLKTLIEAMTTAFLQDTSKSQAQANYLERYLGAAPFSTMALAYAAYQQKDFTVAKKHLLNLRQRAESRGLGTYGLVKVALNQGDLNTAVVLCEELVADFPKAPWVLDIQFKLYARLHRHDEAIAALKSLAKYATLDPDTVNHHEAAILLEKSKLPDMDMEDKIYQLDRAHTLAPGFVPAALDLAKLLRLQDKVRKAKKVIETTWALSPSQSLADKYLLMEPGATPKKQVEIIEHLTSFSPKHPQSLLTMAAATVGAQMWGRTRAHLKELEETKGLNATACRLMAQLELGEKGDEDQYHAWIEKAFAAKADPTWICSGCHNKKDEWHLMCDECRGVDTYKWT